MNKVEFSLNVAELNSRYIVVYMIVWVINEFLLPMDQTMCHYHSIQRDTILNEHFPKEYPCMHVLVVDLIAKNSVTKWTKLLN